MIFICIQNVKSNFKPRNVTSCDCRKHYLYVLHDINKIFHQQNRNTPSTTCSIPQVPHFIVHFIKKPSHCWIGGFGSHMYEKNNSKKRKADKITLTVSVNTTSHCECTQRYENLCKNTASHKQNVSSRNSRKTLNNSTRKHIKEGIIALKATFIVILKRLI